MGHQGEHHIHGNRNSCMLRKKPCQGFYSHLRGQHGSRARSPFEDDDNKPLKQTTTMASRKSLLSKTVAVQVCFLYISLPSSAKQGREMTMFCVVRGSWTTTANFSHFHLELDAAIACLAWALFRASEVLVSLDYIEAHVFRSWSLPRYWFSIGSEAQARVTYCNQKLRF